MNVSPSGLHCVGSAVHASRFGNVAMAQLLGQAGIGLHRRVQHQEANGCPWNFQWHEDSGVLRICPGCLPYRRTV